MFVPNVRGWLGCVALGLVLSTVNWAWAQAIPAPLLSDLKAGAVYVKVSRRTLDWSGSGFVVQKGKNGVLIVTNAHVLRRPKIDDTDIAKNVPVETQRAIAVLQAELRGVESAVSVVFFSGTPEEIALPGGVVAQDDQHDLAVLKVEGAPETVKAIKPNMEKVSELTPLVTLGFPFGGMLATDKTNPTITITRAELTSYKPIGNDMTLMQLQGSLNPGCSGGPVVDTAGKLCGVQVQTIRGSGLGFAIPTEEVIRMVRGRMSDWHAKLTKEGEGSGAKYTLEYRVQLIDPLKKIDKLRLAWRAGAVPVPSEASFKASPTALKDTQTVELKREGAWATVSFPVNPSGAGPLVLTVQPNWTDGNKKPVLGMPEVLRLTLGTETPAGPEDGRTSWHYVDKREGEGWVFKTAAGWDQESDGATHHFVEVKRDQEKVELYDKNRKMGLRLFHERMSFKLPQNKKWLNIVRGNWEASGMVASAK